MSEHIIYTSAGLQRCRTRKVKLSSSFMGAGTLTVTVNSATVIPFAIGDYIDYGISSVISTMRYVLRDTPTPKKVSSSGEYGHAFQYELVFKSALWELKNCPFRDVVLYDNNAHFTSLPDVSTYEDVQGIADRITANINAFSNSGVNNMGAWNIVVLQVGEYNVAKDFSLSNGSCLDALNEIYNIWNLSYIHTVAGGVNTITIGKAEQGSETTSLFKYGTNNGLKALKKSVQNADEIATRIYAYGSTRNMQPRYYNKVTHNGLNIIGNNMYIPNVMLPIEHWGTTLWYRWKNGTNYLYTLSNASGTEYAFESPTRGATPHIITSISASSLVTGGVTYTADGSAQYPDVEKAYIDAPQSFVEKYGIRPKAIYFDGTDGREEVWPHLKASVITGTSMTDDGTLNTSAAATEIGTVTEQAADHPFSITYPSQQSVPSMPILYFNISGLFQMTVTEDKNVYIPTDTSIVKVLAGAGMNMTDYRLTFYIVDCYGVETQIPSIGDNTNGWRIQMTQSDSVSIPAGTYSVGIDGTAMFLSSPGVLTYTCTAQVGAGSVTYKHKPELSSGSLFHISVSSTEIPFDIREQALLAGGTAKLCMLDGACGGWNFDITGVAAITGGWRVTCKRQQDESLGFYYPNKDFQIAAGDHFTLTDICMPDIYIQNAEDDLYDAVQDEEPWVEKFIVEPEISDIGMLRSPKAVRVGMWMQILDSDLGLNDNADPVFVLIDSVSVDDSGNGIPKFSVTLRDEKRDNAIARLAAATIRNNNNINALARKGRLKNA